MVYRGYHSTSRKEVAIKVVDVVRLQHLGSSVEDIIREASIHKALNHKNIVNLLYTFKGDG